MRGVLGNVTPCILVKILEFFLEKQTASILRYRLLPRRLIYSRPHIPQDGFLHFKDVVQISGLPFIYSFIHSFIHSAIV
jgi:hypothetical protein